jgi:DNA-binding response OmpR family regulator
MLLLVEGSSLTDQSLAHALKAQAHSVALAHTPESTEATIESIWPDLIIVNLLDDALNFSPFKAAATNNSLELPALLIVNNKTEVELLKQPILSFPFTVDQLRQEIDRLIKPDRFMRMGKFVLDTHNSGLLCAGVYHRLTPKIFNLLSLLMKNEGQIVNRKTIMQRVWDTDYMGDTRTLDVHMRWLREKIEDDPSHPRHLVTVRGIGYRFVATPQ